MSKNKENKNFDFFTKENNSENYILGIISIAGIIFSILIFFEKISLKGEVLTGNKKIFFGIFLLIISLISLVLSLKDIIKEFKYKNTVFNDLINDFNNNEIKKNLYDEELNLDNLYIEKNKNNLGFEYKVNNGSFYLYADKKQVVFSFDYTDDFVENMSDDEIEKLPLYEIGGFYSILDFNREKLYQEYIKFIKENKED